MIPDALPLETMDRVKEENTGLEEKEKVCGTVWSLLSTSYRFFRNYLFLYKVKGCFHICDYFVMNIKGDSVLIRLTD